MIIRDLTKARIGQFVLVTGRLAAFDLAILKRAWELPAVKAAVTKSALAQNATSVPESSNRKDRQRARHQQPRISPEIDAAFEMMKIMPHTIQATLREDDRTVWSSLREDSLIIPASELLLKHGVGIAGIWSMLGILDALPHGDEASMQMDAMEQILAGLSLGAMAGQVVGQLGPAVRLMLGRPGSAFGMTPLLIFREASG
jgi:hypothetical protein